MSQLRVSNEKLLAELDSLTQEHSREKIRLVNEHKLRLERELEEAKHRWANVYIQYY